ncbi:hypothetical protein [Roseomonas chloroacetimidivorans]|jgi:hypothetical protein|uniref:hypothetical protein n=1 Tax=Roseomonas chloroacetimidivorans TaxID=1766656 RepID=UPI003C745208
MKAAAYGRNGAWELVIQDERGQTLCTWRPDCAFFRDARISTIPTALQMMVAMVEDGVLPLRDSKPDA